MQERPGEEPDGHADSLVRATGRRHGTSPDAALRGPPDRGSGQPYAAQGDRRSPPRRLVPRGYAQAALHLHPDWGSVAGGFVPHWQTGTDTLIYWYFGVGVLAAALIPYEVFFYASGAVEDLIVNKGNRSSAGGSAACCRSR
jgi:hypothetical protein